MRCFKCKKEIADDLLRCNFCNTKVQTVCPVCGNKNPITSEFCAVCALQLLKYCPECKAVNLPNSSSCRKCNTPFEIDEATITISDINQDGVEIKKIETAEIKIKTEPVIPITEITKNNITEAFEPESGPLPYIKPLDISELVLSEEELQEKKSIGSFSDLISLIDNTETTTDEEPNDNPIENTPNSDDSIKAEIIKAEKNDLIALVEGTSPIDDIMVEVLPDEESIENDDTIENNVLPEQNHNDTSEAEKMSNPDCFAEIAEQDQMKCKNTIVKAILNPQTKIIGFSAPEGNGKSTVLKYLFEDLNKKPRVWFWGECSANSQISPFGIFQEMILTFFNMPNFSNMSDEFIKEAKTMLSATLPFLTPNDITNLFNFLYPHLTSYFEDILVNKDITFSLLERLLVGLSNKAPMVIIIDDFDMIDGASYEFLTYFVDKQYLSEKIKLLITYKDKRITQGYFYSEAIAPEEYCDVRLANLTKEDAMNLTKMYLNGSNPIPEEIFDKIYEHSEGNSAYFEQILTLFNEKHAFYNENNILKYQKTELEENLPKNLHEILSLRIKYLKKEFPTCYRTLCTAAIMGNKFNIRLLEIVMKFNPDEYQNIIKLLINYAYITPFNNNIFEFKNTLLWKFIYETAKLNKDFCMLNEKIFDIINTFTLSSNALKALIAQNLNQKLLALNIWTDNIKLCAYLGDAHLWTLSQKQCLKIAGEITPDNSNVIINNIQERLGKLLYESRPSEAIPYLSNAISNALKIGNRPKVIELSGYLSKSCALTGNYNGVIEAVDTVLGIIENEENKLECALIKYKKLKAMLYIGNSEEICNLANNEIIPIIEQALSEIIPLNEIPMEIIYETWLETNLIVSLALILQGNNKCFSVLKFIDEIVAKNNINNKNYIQRVELAKALGHSMLGDIKASDDILITLTQKTTKEMVEPEVISLWNFINILNKLYKQEWTNIKEDLYSVVTFANNYNDVLVKNLLKIFLGRVLQEEENLSKAMDIYNEQVAIFAREKIAIGALLCWYYIAKLSLVTEGSDKALDIAQKALEVTKNPKISNYYFMVMFKKLIAEIYMIKGDMEASKMYIEKALMIVKQYDLKILKVNLYQLYAKYLEEMVAKKPQNRANYAQNAIATYKKAIDTVTPMELPNILADLNKNFASFKAFCQLNDIKI